MTAHASALTKRANRGDVGARSSPRFAANTVLGFSKALERLGYNVDLLFERAGLNRAELERPDAWISCEAVGSFICAAIQQRSMRNLATHMAVATPIGAFPLVDYLVVTADDLKSAVMQLARYIGLGGAPYTLNPQEYDDRIELRFENTVGEFSVEYSVSLAALHLRNETENRLRISCVRFSHSPEDVAEIERLLGCPVRVQQPWSGFEFPREDWHLPMRRGDAALRTLLEQQAEEFIRRLPPTDPVIVQVKQALVSRLGKSDIEIQSIARALATSVRSLQRRLMAAGVTYQKVLDATRQELAAKYLEMASLSVEEVAFLLGYSETAAFHRAFRRWNGVGPQAFRAQKAHVN